MQVEVQKAAVVGNREPSGAIGLEPDIAYLRTGLANVVFVGRPGDWVLIDAGFPGYRNTIRRAAEARFGAGARPRAILLTHGHVDHVGALPRLAEEWDAPVFAHADEHPFLDGSRSYPPARPRLSDGLLSLSSVLFRRSPKDLGARLRALPADGSAPFLPGWRWIATPGHTPGHVSFWHEERRVVIAGDAFVATAQEELLAVLAQRPELHGPPRYFTPDWAAAEASVARLAALRPSLAVTGHGPALAGPQLARGLDELARRFREVAVPPEAALAAT